MKHILIVEDERAQYEILRDKLTKEGFSVLVARNGVEGLQMALEKHPDAILLDVLMPQLDGPSMLKELREDSWGESVPVIVLSNMSGSEEVSAMMSEGAFQYFVKADTSMEQVVQKIREVLKC